MRALRERNRWKTVSSRVLENVCMYACIYMEEDVHHSGKSWERIKWVNTETALGQSCLGHDY